MILVTRLGPSRWAGQALPRFGRPQAGATHFKQVRLAVRLHHQSRNHLALTHLVMMSVLCVDCCGVSLIPDDSQRMAQPQQLS